MPSSSASWSPRCWHRPTYKPIALSLPLLAFYELNILIGGRIEKKREEEARKAEEAADG